MKTPKDFQCLECGRRMTAKQAEKATTGTEGCPGCGGADIDLAPAEPTIADVFKTADAQGFSAAAEAQVAGDASPSTPKAKRVPRIRIPVKPERTEPDNRSASGADNREAWLARAVELLRPMLEAAGGKLPVRLQAGVSWPKGKGSDTIGQCFYKGWTADGTIHVIVSPTLGSDAGRVLDVLLHELVHACCAEHNCGHKGPFKTLATAVGLTGKMTATVASEPLKVALAAMAEQLGPYPHAVMKGATAPKSWKRGAGKRIVLRSTNDHDYYVYMSREMLDEHGAPCDPWGDEMTPNGEPVETEGE